MSDLLPILFPEQHRWPEDASVLAGLNCEVILAAMGAPAVCCYVGWVDSGPIWVRWDATKPRTMGGVAILAALYGLASRRELELGRPSGGKEPRNVLMRAVAPRSSGSVLERSLLSVAHPGPFRLDDVLERVFPPNQRVWKWLRDQGIVWGPAEDVRRLLKTLEVAALFVNLRCSEEMPDQERDRFDDLLDDVERIVDDLINRRKVELVRPV